MSFHVKIILEFEFPVSGFAFFKYLAIYIQRVANMKC